MNVELPDGTVIQGVPDGTTRTQLAERLKRNGRNVPDSWLAGDVGAAFSKGEAHTRIPDAGVQPTPPKEGGVMDTLAGAPGAALTMASSIPASVAGNVAGAVKSMTSGNFGTPEGTRAGAETAQDVTSKLTYTPSEKGARTLKKVGDFIDESKIGGLNPSMPLSAMPPRVIPTVRQILGESKTKVGEGVSSAARAMTPMAAPEKAELARKAQAIGIELRPDMLSDNKIMRMIGEALEKVPLSGSKSEQRQIAFNRAVMKQIGVDTSSASAKRLTPDVYDRAITASGEKIGEIASKVDMPLDDLTKGLVPHVENALKFETADVAKIVTNYVTEIREKAEGGIVSGRALRKINSKMGRQIRNTTNGDLKNALGDLQNEIHEALSRHLPPNELKALEEARRQYAIAKTIEPIVAKSKNGDVSPAGLMGALTSDSTKKSRMARGRAGEMGDIARIGQMFLKEPDSSGTAERAVAYGLVGGGAAGAAYMEPTAAATLYGAANLYNRAGPALSRRMTRVRDLSPEDRRLPVRDLEAE